MSHTSQSLVSFVLRCGRGWAEIGSYNRAEEKRMPRPARYRPRDRLIPLLQHPCSAYRLLCLLFLLLLFLVLLLFASSLNYGSRDTVEVTLTVLGDTAATVIGLLEDTDLLERLADLALHGRRAVRVVRGAVTPAVAATVKLGQGTDADVFPEVDVPCNGSYCIGEERGK